MPRVFPSMASGLVATLVLVLLTSGVSAQTCDPGGGAGGTGADVVVGELTGPNSYGQAGGFYAYAVGTTSCNIGTEELQWIANTNVHPVIAYNMYRLHDGRFEQIGLSWLKHGFTALQQNACGCGCQSSGTGTRLGIGCSDPYSASLNGSQNLGPRSEVTDPANGGFIYPPILNPSNSDLTWRRLRIAAGDLSTTTYPGALYFVDGQYVTPDDAAAGNAHNNVSYRQVTVADNANRSLTFSGGTQRQQPPIQAWQDNDPAVTLIDIIDGDNGLLILGYKSTEVAPGQHRYEYALYNLNSTRAVRAFRLPLPGGVLLSDIGFSDVAYHSGEPYSGTDWSVNQGAGFIEWSTDSSTTNPNANALRWGTLYNFWFTANAPSVVADATMTHFIPGATDTLTAPTLVPSGDFTLPVEGLTCNIVGSSVDLAWTNAEPYDSISVTRDGVKIASLAGTAVSYQDTTPTAGLHTYGVESTVAAIPSGAVTCDVDFPDPLQIVIVGTAPDLVLPDGTTPLAVSIDALPGFTIDPGSEEMRVVSSAGITVVPLIFAGGTTYDVNFPVVACGEEFGWYLQARTTSGILVTLPTGGGASPFVATSAYGLVDDLDEFEIDSGWTVAAPNNATTGNWTRGDPVGTAAQPEDDHSASPGTDCWFTGQGAVGGSLGANDVDGGTTTLYSPVFDLSQTAAPEFSYWRWYNNSSGASPSADIFVVQISDDLLSWIDVEIVGPGGAGTAGGWIQHQFVVSDFVLLSTTVQVRFQASDLGAGSIVEAAVDDFLIHDVDCSGLVDCNLNGVADSIDISTGTSADCDVNGIPDECDIASGAHTDCNANAVPDFCDILNGASDCDSNGVIDSCDLAGGGVDCDLNGQIDVCEIAAGTAADCDSSGTIDSCDLAGGAPDCDANGQIDSCDLAGGAPDCDSNGQIDSCDLAGGGVDCDANGQIDTCEIAAGTALDCDSSGTIDSCDLVGGASDCDANGQIDSCDLAGGAADCNANGQIDSCDIASGGFDCDSNGEIDICEITSGTGSDCDVNGTIDSCDIAGGASDCDGSGILDSCELASGAPDCNSNGALDSCDLSAGTSTDSNGNGIPDECDLPAFIRAEANGDGNFDISDPIMMLEYLFGSGSPTCLSALDANDDGSIDVADAIFTLNALFGGGAVPPSPYPNCGTDPTPDTLPCALFPTCP